MVRIIVMTATGTGKILSIPIIAVKIMTDWADLTGIVWNNLKKVKSAPVQLFH